MNNLYQASSQWASRPADQRFWTINEAYQFCRGYADAATEQTIDFGSAELVDTGSNLALNLGDGSDPITMTHWSFGQLARLAGAPAEYLRKLPAPLASQCLETGLDNFFRSRDEYGRMGLIHGGETPVLRAVTSDKYTRFWNWQVFERLNELQSQGWKVPPARPVDPSSPNVRIATEEDVLAFRNGSGGVAVNVGDPIAPAGIYASDHDMFAFLVNEEYRIDDGSDGGLSRGFFVSNSEVGASSLKMTLFHYRHVCGNHIVWGAENVIDVAVRHIGDVENRFTVELLGSVREHLAKSAKDDEARIQRARRLVLGATKDEVLDAIFKAVVGRRKNGLPSGLNLKMLGSAYDLAEEHADVDGNPKSLWGYVNGMTRLSQQTPFADERMFLDNAAGQILTLAA